MRTLIFLTLLCFVVPCCSLYADDNAQNPWQAMIKALSGKKALKLIVAAPEAVKKLDLGHAACLLNACDSFKVLDGPECRCLPSAQKHLVLFLEDSSLVTLQLVPDHWFYGVVYTQGKVVQFYLKDSSNGLYNLVEEIMNPKPQEVQEPMCSNCKGMMYIMAIGKCSSCGAATTSMSFKFCTKCAVKQGKCQVCTKSLK